MATDRDGLGIVAGDLVQVTYRVHRIREACEPENLRCVPVDDQSSSKRFVDLDSRSVTLIPGGDAEGSAMARDSLGRELQTGDVVTMTFAVKFVSDSALCNVTLEAIDPLERADSVRPVLCCGSTLTTAVPRRDHPNTLPPVPSGSDAS